MMSTEMPPLFTISRTDNSMVSKDTNKVFLEKALDVDVVLDGDEGISLVEVVVLAAREVS